MPSPLTRLNTLRTFPWLRSGRDRASYVGIDIGIDRVRVSTFGIPRGRENKGTTQFRWLSQSEFSLPIDPSLPPPPNWVDQVAECLEDRLPRCIDGEKSVAAIALPLPWIHYQTANGAEIEATRNQCDTMFLQSIFQSNAYVTHWPVIAGKDQELAVATAESAASRIAQCVTEVGYQVQSIMPHGSVLLQNAVSLTSINPAATLLLDFAGGLIAIRNQDNACGLCRNLPACRLPATHRSHADEFESWLQEIATEVDATIRYVSRLNGRRDEQSPVLICGNVAPVGGVDVALASMIGRPVATWRFAGRVRPRINASLIDPNRCDASMAVSLSLANSALESARVVSPVITSLAS